VLAGAQSDRNRHTLVSSPTAFQVPSKNTASRLACVGLDIAGASVTPRNPRARD